MKGAKVKWQVRAVHAEQASIEAELRQVEEQAGVSGAMLYALRQIQLLEAAEGVRADLRRLLYTMQTLALHNRGAGLRPRQVQDAVLLARGLLTAGGVQPGSSRLAFLHAELHLHLSQMYRRKGEHWNATWEQQVALQESRQADQTVHGQHLLVMGQRALRLGHIGLALSYFTQALSALPEGSREDAWLGLVRAHRLGGDAHAARYTQKLFATKHHPSAKAKHLLLWEEACLDLSTAGTPELMLKRIKRRGTHHEHRYLLEASLWVKTLPQRQWMERTLLVRSLGRRPDKPQTLGRLYKLALALEQCYEGSMPLALRLAHLGKTLSAAGELNGVEQELLAWAAAARFLARSNAFDLASLTLLEYGALSRRLSQGQDADVLAVTGDMQKRAWFRSVNLLG